MCQGHGGKKSPAWGSRRAGVSSGLGGDLGTVCVSESEVPHLRTGVKLSNLPCSSVGMEENKQAEKTL